MKITQVLATRKIFGASFVHVGAHTAQELDSYLSLMPRKILWIEADPVTFFKLERKLISSEKLHLASIQWINALVGSSSGSVVPFYRYSNDGASSSIFRETELLRENWKDIGLQETGEVLPLVTRRLDSVLQSLDFSFEGMNCLILDIQGSELEALKGTGSLIGNFDFVEVEVSQEEIYSGAPLFDEVDGFLSKNGFKRITGIPWHGDVVYENCRQKSSPPTKIVFSARWFARSARRRVFSARWFARSARRRVFSALKRLISTWSK